MSEKKSEKNGPLLISVQVKNKNGIEIDSFKMRTGSNLWVFLRKRGLPIGSACSGVGVCGACNVGIKSLEAANVTPQSSFEKETLSRNQKPLSQRLACLCRIYSNVEVTADYW